MNWSRLFDDAFRLGFAALLACAAWAAARQLRRESRGRGAAVVKALAGAAGVALVFGVASGAQVGAFVFVVVGASAVAGAAG